MRQGPSKEDEDVKDFDGFHSKKQTISDSFLSISFQKTKLMQFIA